MKLEFKLWMEQLTQDSEKLDHLARRIQSFTLTAANQAKSAGKAFKEFQTFNANYGLHQPGIYNYLTTRYSGRQESDPETLKKLSQMLQQVATINEPQAVYTKGAGWHHWIINGDMQRGEKGTNKTYVPVHKGC